MEARAYLKGLSNSTANNGGNAVVVYETPPVDVPPSNFDAAVKQEDTKSVRTKRYRSRSKHAASALDLIKKDIRDKVWVNVKYPEKVTTFFESAIRKELRAIFGGDRVPASSENARQFLIIHRKELYKTLK
jgi:hypothetical protein